MGALKLAHRTGIVTLSDAKDLSATRFVTHLPKQLVELREKNHEERSYSYSDFEALPLIFTACSELWLYTTVTLSPY